MRTLLAFFCAGSFAAAGSLYDSVQHKLDAIETRQVRPGSVVSFTPQELNGWARVAVPKVVPEGMRDEQVELFNGSATGYAMVDFLKMRQGKGEQTNWLIARMIEGERPLKIWVRVESGGGRCTVYLTRVDLSDVTVNQTVLNFLITNFFMPLYPDAKIDQPFELDYNIDRIAITPQAVHVTIKR
ncbi:MAG TPA: hypothetical protein VMB85_09700 [Bryobacteraceae bacterium]|jgi:hypothetical protein|nr:hypothetical protein [Bryobacteraceae bacterium]